jgi:hypothetical protein
MPAHPIVGYFRPNGFDLIHENCHEEQGIPSQAIDTLGINGHWRAGTVFA